MRHLGYPEKIVRILENLYSETLSAVRVNGNITEWFKTLVGVLQGCILSPLLFNIFLEVVLARALWNLDIGVVISGYRLNNLRFADDIAAICNNNQGLDTIVTNMATESRRMGMSINTDKTETQLIGKHRGPCDIKLEGQVLNQVEDFVYLGGLISSTGSSHPDVRRRIGLACDAVRRLTKIWKSKTIRKATKVKVYETMVLSILCYNSETWTLTAEIKRQLRVFEMGCLRRIMDVTRRDCIKNGDIRDNLDISEDIVERIQARRLRYFGHVVRMDQHRLPNIALYGRVDGNRAKGRPRKRWLDNVTEDCCQLSSWLEHRGGYTSSN